MPNYYFDRNDLENYSQKAINRGQRKINAGLSTVDEKLVKALEAVKAALAEEPGRIRTHLDAIDAAIKAAYATSKEVAEIIPPGCDFPW